jgi:arylformamidase
MYSFDEIYDISISLGGGSIDWPGLPVYDREYFQKISAGDACDVSFLKMPAHVGTHIDTPSHFVAGAKNLDEYPVEEWIFQAHVVNIEDKEAVHRAELAALEILPGEALLFKTRNSSSDKYLNGIFDENYIYISLDAAEFIVEKQVGLVGIDYNNVDKYEDYEFPVHRKILGNGIRIVESINLNAVEPGRYTLVCLPLKIKGAEGAPARAFLSR